MRKATQIIFLFSLVVGLISAQTADQVSQFKQFIQMMKMSLPPGFDFNTMLQSMQQQQTPYGQQQPTYSQPQAPPPAYSQPQAPPPAPAYSQPQAPPSAPAYSQPQAPPPAPPAYTVPDTTPAPVMPSYPQPVAPAPVTDAPPTYSQPAAPAPAYSQPAVPAPAPAYSQPAAPAPAPAYSQPAAPAPAPAYSQPAAPAPAPAYSQPAAPAPVAAYSQPPSGYSSMKQFFQTKPVISSAYGVLQNFPPQPPLTQTPVTPCSPSPCLNGATCTIMGGQSYQCACPWGFIGTNCETCTNDCASNPCPSSKKCRARYGGGFDCVCPSDRLGANCELSNDICTNNPCLNGGACSPADGGSYQCQCMQPWAGQNCDRQFVNPCTSDVLRATNSMQFKDPWVRTNFLVCTDVSNFISMQCSVGTFFSDVVNHCVPDGYVAATCSPSFCANDGDCFVDQGGSLQCNCKAGFSGSRCQQNIDDCANGGNAACQGGQCIDQINTYYCQCQNNLVGLSCQQAISNPCTSNNLASDLNYFTLPSPNGDHYLHCTGELTFQARRCPDGLFWHPELNTCTVDRPALKLGLCLGLPCKNGGECQEQGGSFACSCQAGYTGASCEQIIDFCVSNPCQNGGRCLSYSGGYTCVCPDKVIDDCCCHGVMNPCPPKTKLMAGLNNYYPHLYLNKYIHCDFDGRAFVRTCALNLKWNQQILSCVPDEFFINTTSVLGQQAPLSQYGQQPSTGYGQAAAPPAYNQPQAPPSAPAYNQPQAPPSAPAYSQPQAPPPAPAYNQPQAPPSAPAYNQPQAPPSAPAYSQPQAPPPAPAYNQPQAPPAPAYSQPQAPPPAPAYSQPQAPPPAPAYSQPQAPPSAPAYNQLQGQAPVSAPSAPVVDQSQNQISTDNSMQQQPQDNSQQQQQQPQDMSQQQQQPQDNFQQQQQQSSMVQTSMQQQQQTQPQQTQITSDGRFATNINIDPSSIQQQLSQLTPQQVLSMFQKGQISPAMVSQFMQIQKQRG